jgi:hypothetical protein
MNNKEIEECKFNLVEKYKRLRSGSVRHSGAGSVNGTHWPLPFAI